jgi:putative aldouronate transport system permease protein
MQAEQDKAVTMNRKRKRTLHASWARVYPLYVMLIPGVVAIFIFQYIPMYGVIIAFQDFRPVHGFWGSRFVGLHWFRFVLNMPEFGNIIRNTFVIAIGKVIADQAVAIGFALLLNELRHSWYKRTLQTAVYLPNFLSWVIIGGIFIDILSTRGLFNDFIALLGFERQFFLGSNRWFQLTMIWTDVWKSFGFNAILYLAALTNINPEQYESGIIDGANRFELCRFITIPGMMPTIILLATLNLGQIMEAGFEQILIMYNPAVYRTGDIIDTFVFRAGLIDSQFSLAAAVGLGKSVVAFFLIVISYRLADKYAGYRIF